MLRALLSHAEDDPQTGALARDGGRAFVLQALRPYLTAALLDRDPACRRSSSRVTTGRRGTWRRGSARG